MEKFVNILFKSSIDLSKLTHRIIRERYLKQIGREKCIGEEKAKLKALVESKMKEIMTKSGHNSPTKSPKPNKAKVAVVKQKKLNKDKTKRKRTVDTSESDAECDPSTRIDSTTKPLMSEDSTEEYTQNSSTFEEESPAKKKMWRRSKRKRSSTVESDSDSEQEKAQNVEKRTSHDLLQQNAKRRNVKLQISDDSDSDVRGARELKHGSVDQRKMGSAESELGGKVQGKPARKACVRQAKTKVDKSNGFVSEDTDDEDRLAIVTDTDSDTAGRKTKIAQKARNGSDFGSEDSDAMVIDERESDAVVNRTDKIPVTRKATKKAKPRPEVYASSETDSEVEEIKKKRSHSFGTKLKSLTVASKLMRFGKTGNGLSGKGKKKWVIVSDFDESGESERCDLSDSGQSDVDAIGEGGRETSRKVSDNSDKEGTDETGSGQDVRETPIVEKTGTRTKAENSRKATERSDEDVTDESSSESDSVVVKKRPTANRFSRNTGTKLNKLRKLSGDSDEDVSDESSSESDSDAVRKRFVKTKKARCSLVESGTGSEAEDSRRTPSTKQKGAGKQRKASGEKRKPQTKASSVKSSQNQNVKKLVAPRKSKKQLLSSNDEEMSADSLASPTKKASEKKDQKIRGKKPPGATARVNTSQSEGNSSEEEPLGRLKETSAHNDRQSSSDSDDGGTIQKGKQKTGQTKYAKALKPSSLSKKVTNLKGILRACNSMPVGKQYSIMFGDCHTDVELVKKLKRLLVSVGMTGRPSIKKAEAIRLKKELAELDMGNIISSKGRSLRDTRRGRFEYGAPISEPVNRPVAPSCDTFKNLSGLVDSEGSDSSS